MSPFDPMRVIEVLARHGVEFVVIGGFAAELYGAPIPPTQDIDVTPRLSPPNLARLSAALHELDARVRTAAVPEGLPFSHDAASLGRTAIWNLTTGAGDLDLSFRPSSTDGYEDLVASAVVVDIAGHHLAVAALADVVRSKEAAGRPKDLAVLDTLRPWLDTLRFATLDDLRAGVLQVLRQRADQAAATFAGAASRPYDVAGLPRKPEVGAEGFAALDLRAGRVVDVEPFPEARKPAWKLTVDFGPVLGTLRTSAHVTNYPAHELRGRMVVGACNLGRKRIAGFVSEFLVLGALEADGTVRLLEVPGDVEPGAPVA